MWPTHYIPYQPRLEGIPPQRYYYTSPPYALQVIEELTANSTSPLAYLVPSAEINENLISSGAPVSGELRDILLRYDGWPEDVLESTGEPVSGVLADILVIYTAPTETLESSGEPVSGVLMNIRVAYDNWPLDVATESLSSAGAPVSGVLS